MSSPKLLLNAEPFGFGPSAAIASVFPHLRSVFDTVGYVGKHHTLDLQRALPYDQIHDVSSMGKEERFETLQPIFAEYDIFLSAMDHKMVELAQRAGLKVFYYDALAWYWTDIPQSVQKADLYIAQDFFGVEQRLSDIFGASAGNTARIAPIVTVPEAKQRRHVTLINLGGLQNPFTPIEDLTCFARDVIDNIKKALPQETELVIASSNAIVERLGDAMVRTYPRAEMEDILTQSSAAFMTPGLGNIYDAAAYDIPTIWLPPANDSQGQQMRLLKHNNMLDAALDWHDFMAQDAIDYSNEQLDVLEDISRVTQQFATDKKARQTFRRQARVAHQALQPHSCTSALIERFGSGGERQMAGLVTRKAASLYPQWSMKNA
jgi:hypothetical protein